MNPSTALATVLAEALADLGVRHVVLCPGSRSAPLAYAFAAAEEAGRLQVHVRIDERAAGFLALGLAKENGVPAAVVTTSGTAVANVHPAVLEASHAGVPMLVLSADRPHELRGTGANQTTDQVKIFGAAVRWAAEIPAPERRAGQVAGWRGVAVRAVAAARGAIGHDPGPVHVNVAFREPLVPDDDGDWPEPPIGGNVTEVVPAHRETTGEPLAAGPRTVVLAGDGTGPVAALVAAAADWPLLAEPTSGARFEDAVGPYRLLLDVPHLGGAIERVVVFGRPTLSRPVTRLLARPGVEVVVVTRRPAWPDPSGLARRVVVAVAPPEAPAEGTPAAEWAAAWRTAGRLAAEAIDEVLEEQEWLTGPLVAREVARALVPGGVLVTGASNSVRDLDLTSPPTGSAFGVPDGRHAFVAGAVEVIANRGLAGIDGTLSTAAGIALARAARAEQDAGHASELADLGAPPDAGDQVVRVLVGDLTFLHDAGGLLAGLRERRPDLQVVVMDDGGGGVFGGLEPGDRGRRGAADHAVFERFFATPVDADLEALCAAYRVGYLPVESLGELRDALTHPGTGITVVHVRIDRSSQPELMARLGEAARRVCATAGSPR